MFRLTVINNNSDNYCLIFSFFQLRGLMRSSWGRISWWRSSIFLVTPLTNQIAAEHSWEWIHCLTLIFCTVCPNKVLQSELVDFPSLLWASALVFPHQFLCLPAEWVEHELVHVWLYMAVYTCTLCSCEHQRWRRKKKQWEGWPQRRGGYVYLYTKWCMRRPRTTQLDPVSVNTVTPPSNTRTQQRKPTRAPDTFFLCFLLLFFPLLYSLCSQDLLHSSSWAFLKLQVGSSLVTKEEDESRHV